MQPNADSGDSFVQTGSDLLKTSLPLGNEEAKRGRNPNIGV